MKKTASIVLALSFAGMNVLAGWHDGRDRGWDRDRRGGDRHDVHYSYRGDHWVRNGWFGLGAAVVGALTIGAIAESMPPRYTTVVVGNEPYYYFEGNYFRPAPGGYVVVPAPVVQQQPVVVVPAPQPVVYATPAPQPLPAQQPSTVIQQQAAPQQAATTPPPILSEITVNIPNDKGTYTPVTMQRSGTGFIGPQGEFYPEFPRVEQLKLMYGK